MCLADLHNQGAKCWGIKAVHLVLAEEEHNLMWLWKLMLDQLFTRLEGKTLGIEIVHLVLAGKKHNQLCLWKLVLANCTDATKENTSV